MNASPIASLVRGWVNVYTHGLPDAARAARRDEVDDDLWCQHEEASASGRAPSALAIEMTLRLLFGMPADVSWRLSVGGGGASQLERRPSTGDRVLGVLAIVAALCWGIAVVLMLVVGPSSWTGMIGWFMFINTLVGGLAFAGAAIGVALRLTDRISVFGAMGGVLGGIGVLFGALGGYQADILLPMGSAILVWDLGRVGILSVRCAAVHVAAATAALAFFVIALSSYEAALDMTWLVLLILPYLVSWLLIGVWLLGGVPSPREHPVPDRPL